MRKSIPFVDHAKVFIKAGDGGNGAISFHRAKYVPKGGPDGGDGGRGGDIVLIGTTHATTLRDYQHRRHFRAQSGQPGGGAHCAGKDGSSIELRVPPGTAAYDAADGTLLGEVALDGECVTLEEGGRGGKGNMHFATPTDRTPRKATPGIKREGKWIRLEMRLLADVGIVGPPNAGKSTLLGALTAAKPKVADYPFTTLYPSLGVFKDSSRTFTLADIPGLIEGAHEGQGLGTDFLRHVERTKVLLFLVAGSVDDPKSPWKEFSMTRNEIVEYSKELERRPFLVALNKIDLLTDRQIQANVKPFHARGIKPIAISAAKSIHLPKLVQQIEKNLAI